MTAEAAMMIKDSRIYGLVLSAAALLVLTNVYAANSAVDTWVDRISVIPTPHRETIPVDRYTEILPSAEEGDRDAQYELAKVYEFCVLAPDDTLMAALRDGGMPDRKLALFERNRGLCEGFDIAYEDWGEPRDAIDYWTSEALLQDHPIALAEESIKAYGLWVRQENNSTQLGAVTRAPARPTTAKEVYAALSYGVEHPELLGYAVRQGYRFFRLFRADEYMAEQGYAPGAGRVKRGPLREAWSILGCHYLASCSIENHLDGMSQVYDVDYVDETVETVLGLYEAILVGDWEQLGLSSDKGSNTGD